MNELIFTKFFHRSKKNEIICIKVNSKELEFINSINQRKQLFKLTDICGSYIEDKIYTRTLYILIMVKKITDRIERNKIVIELSTLEDFCNDMDRLNIILRWISYPMDSNILFSSILDKNMLPPSRKYLFLINPKSGRGRGLLVYRKFIEPFLKYGGIDASVIVSTSEDHLKAIGGGLGAANYECIGIVGGDGTVHIVMNSYFKYKNDENSRLPTFLQIPAGSGNALSSSSADQFNEINCHNYALFCILKGIPCPLFLSKINIEILDQIDTIKNMEVISFLSIEWGIIADIDIDSIPFRFLGDKRFILLATKNILCRKGRNAQMYYLPFDAKIDYSVNNYSPLISKDSGWIKYGDYLSEYLGILSVQLRKITSDIILSDSIKLGQEYINLAIITSNIPTINLIRCLGSSNIRKTLEKYYPARMDLHCSSVPKASIIQVKGFYLETNSGYLVIDGELYHNGSFKILQMPFDKKVSTLVPNTIYSFI